MVTMEQVRCGLVMWIDNAILPQLEDLPRLAYGTAVGLALRKADNLRKMAQENELIKMLDIVDEAGNVDLEAIVEQLGPRLRAHPWKMQLPARQVPLLGELPGLNITITEQALHDVCTYIERS